MQHSRPDWLGTDHYPFDLSSISLGDGPITYVDVGSGPVLLFVHAGMWSFVFRDAIERLRSDFRCITLDFPGYGLSPIGERELEVRDLARVLSEFVEQLDLRNVTLVAHDLGGPVGLAAAAHAPGSILRDGARQHVCVDTGHSRPAGDAEDHVEPIRHRPGCSHQPRAPNDRNPIRRRPSPRPSRQGGVSRAVP